MAGVHHSRAYPGQSLQMLYLSDHQQYIDPESESQCPFIPFNPLTIKFPIFTAAQNRNIFMSRTDQMHSRLISTLFIRSAYPVTRHTRNAVSNDHNRHRNRIKYFTKFFRCYRSSNKNPFIFEELIKLQVKNSSIPSLSILTRTSSHPCSPASLRNSCSTELSKWAKGDDVR